jgi:Tol biopolymer transport system component
LLNILPVAGGAPKILAASYDGQPNVAGWSPDGKRLYFSERKAPARGYITLDVAANKIIRNH